MILLFLGSWRSTVIIAISIPLSILGSIIALSAIGQTLNLMTLGGLALAIGILVDDATVTIENVNWHLENGKDVETAILDGAQQIVTPGVRLAAVHLHCIRADVLPRRRVALPVRADGRGGHLRHGVLVHPLAHPGADDGHVLVAPACSAYRPAWQRRRAAAFAQPAGAAAAWIRGQVRALSCRLSRSARRRACQPWPFHRRLRAGGGALVRAGAVPRRQLLSRGGFGPGPDACARAGRHPGGRNRERASPGSSRPCAK